MDWDKLRIFKAVAEAGSFTRAGENFNLSQSAISRKISTLETELGVSLFRRHGRGLALTEQGEILLQTTSEVFRRLTHVEAELTDSRVLPEGPLTITATELVGSTWLAPQMAAFKKSYPDIQMTLLLDSRIYDLARGEADVALRLEKTNQSDMIEHYMMSLNFCLCASRQYLKDNGYPKNLDDFHDHTMIGYPQNFYTAYLKPNWIFNRLNINLQNNSNILLINSLHARYEAVQSHVGISVLPRYIIDRNDDMEILFPDLEIPSVDMYFTYQQERKNSRRIEVLLDFLLEHIRSMQADRRIGF